MDRLIGESQFGDEFESVAIFQLESDLVPRLIGKANVNALHVLTFVDRA